MNRRQTIAILALLGFLDSAYLLLHKLGYVGSLACTVQGACDLVNTSEYSTFLGLPVAGYGVVGYVVILAVAVAGSEGVGRRIDLLLAVLAGGGAIFSLYLTYVSLFVIGTACPWCLVSLALILTIFGLAVWGAWEYRLSNKEYRISK